MPAQIQEQMFMLPAGGDTNRLANFKNAGRWLAKGGLPPAPGPSALPMHASRQSAVTETAGFVLDWELVHSALHDFTFQGRRVATYVIVSQTHLNGTTTI